MNFIFFFDINRRCRDQRAQTKLEAKIGLDRGLKVLLAAGELEAVDVRPSGFESASGSSSG
jgi:hypothetical protein